MALILLRGGGDLATGIALRLIRSGLRLVITELAEPLAVRRTVSFSEALYEGAWTVEGTTATRVETLDEAVALASQGGLPIVAAPSLPAARPLPFGVIIDARLTKLPPDEGRSAAPLVVGIGPGFTAGVDCHAVVETQRGHTLGRVLWSGSATADTAQPEGEPTRVLRAPADGPITAAVSITDHVEAGQLVATVAGRPITSPFAGILRGLIRPGRAVTRGLKIGDVDPRGVRNYCFLASDKALAIGGGVLEAILSRPDVRTALWS